MQLAGNLFSLFFIRANYLLSQASERFNK